MPKVRYSNKAVEGLTSIWEYTFSKWSESQADEYYEMLISACNRLLYPSIISNRSYDEITDGLLGVKTGVADWNISSSATPSALINKLTKDLTS